MGTAHVGSTSKLPVRGNLAVRYVVATDAIEVRAFWCCLYADIFLCNELRSSASMLQYPSVTPADGMVLRPGMFGYGIFVCEAFDAYVLMLLQLCFESMYGLTNILFSAGAWHFV